MSGNSTTSIKIVVATHKVYKMPTDIMYMPLQVGAKGKGSIGFQRDDEGDNISSLNPFYCELTGLYWAWKNLNDDYIGLAHYRRHFCMKRKGGFDNILTYSELEPYLGKVKVFVPNKRRYFIETLYSHYKHTHYSNQLDEIREIIAEKYPDYATSYERVIKHTYGHMLNMMIMEKHLLDDYCSWLFDILFELGKRLEMPALSDYQRRYYGRISEIIFNVWLDEKKKSGVICKNEVLEIPYIHIEKVNWWKKGTSFLKAKFFGKKYDSSF